MAIIDLAKKRNRMFHQHWQQFVLAEQRQPLSFWDDQSSVVSGDKNFLLKEVNLFYKMFNLTKTVKDFLTIDNIIKRTVRNLPLEYDELMVDEALRTYYSRCEKQLFSAIKKRWFLEYDSGIILQEIKEIEQKSGKQNPANLFLPDNILDILRQINILRAEQRDIYSILDFGKLFQGDVFTEDKKKLLLFLANAKVIYKGKRKINDIIQQYDYQKLLTGLFDNSQDKIVDFIQALQDKFYANNQIDWVILKTMARFHQDSHIRNLAEFVMQNGRSEKIILDSKMRANFSKDNQKNNEFWTVLYRAMLIQIVQRQYYLQQKLTSVLSEYDEECDNVKKETLLRVGIVILQTLSFYEQEIERLLRRIYDFTE